MRYTAHTSNTLPRHVLYICNAVPAGKYLTVKYLTVDFIITWINSTCSMSSYLNLTQLLTCHIWTASWTRIIMLKKILARAIVECTRTRALDDKPCLDHFQWIYVSICLIFQPHLLINARESSDTCDHKHSSWKSQRGHGKGVNIKK